MNKFNLYLIRSYRIFSPAFLLTRVVMARAVKLMRLIKTAETWLMLSLLSIILGSICSIALYLASNSDNETCYCNFRIEILEKILGIDVHALYLMTKISSKARRGIILRLGGCYYSFCHVLQESVHSFS